MIFTAQFSFSSFGQNFYPEGFNEEIVVEGLYFPVGYLPVDTNVSMVYEVNGKVWLVENNIVHPNPIIDISEEVGWFGDNGMIGAVLDPDFLNNGYLYLYYTVDLHYLKYFGTSEYDPNESEVNTASMGRITRYTVNTSDLTTVVPNSRKIILGETIGDGIPVCTLSHSVGALEFGEDGSLLATSGDGSTWVGMNGLGYNGTGNLPAFAYDSLALELGILRSDEMLGSFRAQYLDGLNGKVLRINPETGHGISNNPFFDPENPDGARSKIWSLGLRNPYRMKIKPESGYGYMENGFPGIIMLADVGDWVWEELNIVYEPGMNFGWPMFQGPVIHPLYWNNPTLNTNAPNPLFGDNCESAYFTYQETVIASNAAHSYQYPNPCDSSLSINADIIKFFHSRPPLSWANEANTSTPFAVTPSYDSEGNESYHLVNNENFQGLSSTGGDFFIGDHIPEEYQGSFIAADYTGWLRAFHFNEVNELEKSELWNENIGRPVNIIYNPFDGCMYVTTIFPSHIRRICFGGNLRPVLKFTPVLAYGPSPLTVVFDASESYDPEGGPLTYLWDFGDGNNSTEPTTAHTFYISVGQLLHSVSLTVSDSLGASTSAIIPISLNNSPPRVNITSIRENELYASDKTTKFNLLAHVIDRETTPDSMMYDWTLRLHHNTHYHVLNTFQGNDLITEISPTGCSQNETYWYEIIVKVTDEGGLSDTDSRFIFPDCEGEMHLALENPLVVYPNPVNSHLHISTLTSFEGNFEYVILGIDGRKVMDEKFQVFNERNTVSLDVSHLLAGVYVIRFLIEQVTYVEKFVKTDM